jgi:FkbM family methyltransferase
VTRNGGEAAHSLPVPGPPSARYRLAACPAVGYPLLLAWARGWLPTPDGEATAALTGGRKLRCQLADRTQRTMYLGLFEPRETELVAELLGPGATFIDVGAHIGWFTTIAAARVGGAGDVVAFEPYPATAALLRENVARNQCRNVRVVQAAVGSRPGTLTLGMSGSDSGSVTALDWAGNGRTEVPLTTLDEVTAGGGQVALIKIDVEGWEAHVLRGGPGTLARTRYVLTEINPPALARAGSSPDEVTGLLRAAGFIRFVPVVQRGLRRLHHSAVHNILAMRK